MFISYSLETNAIYLLPLGFSYLLTQNIHFWWKQGLYRIFYSRGCVFYFYPDWVSQVYGWGLRTAGQGPTGKPDEDFEKVDQLLNEDTTKEILTDSEIQVPSETNAKIFHCYICSKEYKISFHLKQHIRNVHEEKKNYNFHTFLTLLSYISFSFDQFCCMFPKNTFLGLKFSK